MGFSLSGLLKVATFPVKTVWDVGSIIPKKLGKEALNGLESVTGSRAIKNAIGEQQATNAANRAKLASEQAKAQSKADAERNRLNQSIARANRGRRKGGLFSDTETTAGSTPTLG